MRDRIRTGGIVLDAAPQGENSRRLVLLSQDLGKISVFANGARREGSALSAASQRFAMGEFQIARGYSAWQLDSARLRETFWDLSRDIEKMCLASYFADLTGFFTREGMTAKDELNLLYVTFRALLREGADMKLIRSAFLWKLLDVEGVGPNIEMCEELIPGEAGAAALRYILSSPISRLYGFSLTPENTMPLLAKGEEEMKKQVDIPLKSLAILDSIM